MTVLAETFLAQLHPGTTRGQGTCICAFPPGSPPLVRFFETPKQALRHAHELDQRNGHAGVYFTVPEVGRPTRKGQRGREEHAVACRAVWVEVDALDHGELAARIAERGGGKDAKDAVWAEATDEERTAAKAGALAPLEAAVTAGTVPPPSARVDSGRGWHVYWYLLEPAAGENLRLLKGCNRALADLLGGDKCIDLARVLRVPGTTHRKDPARPLACSVAYLDTGRCYDLAALAEQLGAKPEALTCDKRPRAASGAAGGRASGEQARADVIERARRWLEKADPAIEGQQGGGTAMRVIGGLARGFDLDSETVLSLLGPWNERCDPPWSEHELQHKVDSVQGSPDPKGRARGWLLERSDRGPPRAGGKPHDLPTIDVGGELRDLLPAVWRALLRQERERRTLYVRGGALVSVREDDDAPVIEVQSVDHIHGRVFRAARWVRTSKEGEQSPARPTKDAARDIIAFTHERLPRLEGIVTRPAYGRGWHLVARNGYDPDARLYGAMPSDLARLDVPDAPTNDDIGAAVAAIDDVLEDFPLAKDFDIAHAYAALVLPFVRFAIEGPTPIHLIEASTAGSGKGLLVALIGAIVLGAPPPITTLPRDGDELRKRLTSTLLEGRELMVFDNATQVDLSELAAVVTADVWSDRVLGSSKTVTLPIRCSWFLTGNNPALTSELARRCIRIRLEPDCERPEERTDFKYPNLLDRVRTARASLVRAVLVLVRAWLSRGRPYSGRRLGSFEAWSEVVGGVLEVAGMPGFLDDRQALRDRADGEGTGWRAFVALWATEHRTAAVTSSTLVRLLEVLDDVPAALVERANDTTRSKTTRLGMALGRVEGRVFADWRIERVKDGAKRSLWRLAEVSR